MEKVADISARYRVIREKMGLPQDEMAAKLGMKQTAYSHLERKAKFIDPAVSDKLIALGVSPIFILVGALPIFMPGMHPPARELPPGKTFRPHMEYGPNPHDLLNALKGSLGADERDLHDWQDAYKRLAESILPHMESIDNSLKQIAAKKMKFVLAEE